MDKEEKAKEKYAAIVAEMSANGLIAWQYLEAYINWQIDDYTASLALDTVETSDDHFYFNVDITLGGTHTIEFRIHKDMPVIDTSNTDVPLWMYDAKIEVQLHPDAGGYESLTTYPQGDDKYFWIAMYVSADD